jgi:hypothetical protein
VFEGAVDGVEVEAAVRGEFLVLGGDQGDGQLRRNLLPVTPFVAQTETVFADALDMPRQHEGAGGGVDPAQRHHLQQRHQHEPHRQPQQPPQPAAARPGAGRGEAHGLGVSVHGHDSTAAAEKPGSE